MRSLVLICKVGDQSFAGDSPLLRILTKEKQTMTPRYRNPQVTGKSITPITTLGQSIVVLHKVLKEEDMLKAMRKRETFGEPVSIDISIAIDFTSVTSIQEDYKNNGTVIIDKKTAVVVHEPFNEVLAVWVDVQERMQH